MAASVVRSLALPWRSGAGWLRASVVAMPVGFIEDLCNHIATPNKCDYLIGMPNFLAAASMMAFF
jgi:hypothetical protein